MFEIIHNTCIAEVTLVLDTFQGVGPVGYIFTDHVTNCQSDYTFAEELFLLLSEKV